MWGARGHAGKGAAARTVAYTISRRTVSHRRGGKGLARIEQCCRRRCRVLAVELGRGSLMGHHVFGSLAARWFDAWPGEGVDVTDDTSMSGKLGTVPSPLPTPWAACDPPEICFEFSRRVEYRREHCTLQVDGSVPLAPAPPPIVRVAGSCEGSPACNNPAVWF